MLIQSVHLIVVFCAFFVSCFDFRASTFLYIDCVFRAVCEVTFNFSRCVFARITNLFFFLLAFFFSCVSQLHFALLFRCCAHFFAHSFSVSLSLSLSYSCFTLGSRILCFHSYVFSQSVDTNRCISLE